MANYKEILVTKRNEIEALKKDIDALIETFQKNLSDAVEKANASAMRRARVASVELAKKMKELRQLSLGR